MLSEDEDFYGNCQPERNILQHYEPSENTLLSNHVVFNQLAMPHFPLSLFPLKEDIEVVKEQNMYSHQIKLQNTEKVKIIAVQYLSETVAKMEWPYLNAYSCRYFNQKLKGKYELLLKSGLDRRTLQVDCKENQK